MIQGQNSIQSKQKTKNCQLQGFGIINVEAEDETSLLWYHGTN